LFLWVAALLRRDVKRIEYSSRLGHAPAFGARILEVIGASAQINANNDDMPTLRACYGTGARGLVSNASPSRARHLAQLYATFHHRAANGAAEVRPALHVRRADESCAKVPGIPPRHKHSMAARRLRLRS
jgi:hypothetical protein